MDFGTKKLNFFVKNALKTAWMRQGGSKNQFLLNFGQFPKKKYIYVERALLSSRALRDDLKKVYLILLVLFTIYFLKDGDLTSRGSRAPRTTCGVPLGTW